MRLLIVTPEFAPHTGGGLARYYGTLTPALVRAGLDVTVLVAAPSTDEFDPYDTPEGVRVRCIPHESIREADATLAQFSAVPEFRRWLAAAWAARQAVSPESIDVIEVTDFGLTFVPFVIRSTGRPVVVRCHGSLGQISNHEPTRPALGLDLALARLSEVTLLPFADSLQTYAETNAREWFARLNRHVDVLHPAMPLLPQAPSRDDYAVIVGRIQAWKGPEVLCKALRRLPLGACPKVLWVGRDTETADGAESLSACLRREYPDVWGQRIEPIGPRTAAEVAGLVSRARFAIVPSAWDVFNFTAVEAMAAGKVVVCSRGAGAHELIAEGDSGLLCDVADENSLAEAVSRAAALACPEAHRIGQNARSVVRDKLDPAAAARAHIASYEGLRVGETACSDWTGTFFEPMAAGQVGLDFLEQVAVRSLGAYMADRLRRRLSAGRTGESGT